MIRMKITSPRIIGKHSKSQERMPWYGYVMAIAIILNPLVNSFFGLDVGDTGLHYTNFMYLYTRPDIAGYSTFFTSMVGNAWIQTMGFLGVWGLNFLEVIVEWLISFIVYRWLRDHYPQTVVLAGVLLASLAAGTYLNVFNYHQFSVLLILCFLLCAYKGMNGDSRLFTFLSGVFLVLAICARISSIVCVATYLLYFVFLKGRGHKGRYLLRHLAFAMFGVVAMGGCFLAFFFLSGLTVPFLESMSKLKGMAGSATGSYSSGNLVANLVFGVTKTLATPLIMCGAAALFLGFLRCVSRKTVFDVVVAIVLLVASAVLVKFSYGVNPVNGSPQLTTGPNVIMGVLLFTSLLRCIQVRDNPSEFAIVCMSILLPLFILASSSTGTKHIAISTWLMAPIFVYEIVLLWNYLVKQENYGKLAIGKASAILLVLFVVACPAYKFGKFLMQTNNFDSPNRLTLTQTVDSPNTKWLLTTSREAETLSGLSAAYKGIANNEKLIVFGSGIGLYFVLDAEPFDRAWISNASYTTERFKERISGSGQCPPIVFCRTNQYFGYGIETYNKLASAVKKDTYGGKKELLKDYIVSNGYAVEYCDDYYILFSVGGEPINTDELNELVG